MNFDFRRTVNHTVESNIYWKQLLYIITVKIYVFGQYFRLDNVMLEHYVKVHIQHLFHFLIRLYGKMTLWPKVTLYSVDTFEYLEHMFCINIHRIKGQFLNPQVWSFSRIDFLKLKIWPFWHRKVTFAASKSAHNHFICTWKALYVNQLTLYILFEYLEYAG